MTGRLLTALHDYMSSIGIPNKEGFLLSSFVYKTHSLLPKGEFNYDQVMRALYQSLSYFRSSYNN